MANSKGTAVVTGASAGLGKIYADRLAARGYDLLLIARRADLLSTVAADIRTRHAVEVETLAADLSSANDIEKVAEKLGRDKAISLLVNNAGTSKLGETGGAPYQVVAAMTELNVSALVRLSLAVLPGFKSRNHGTIINIGSVLGFDWLPISNLYSATKGFVHNFTRALSEEVANTGITVQLVAPAATATDIWEISGLPLSALDPAFVMSPEECVDAALAGLDLGEPVTMPSLEDTSLLIAFDKARKALLAGAQTGKPASRYTRTG